MRKRVLKNIVEVYVAKKKGPGAVGSEERERGERERGY